jgi:phenylpropionate dioxygenase-like ring-hydroxylating dioxygenase large terminal subunit
MMIETKVNEQATPARPRAFGAHSTGRRDWATWPKYEAAVLGFKEYWYPVTWSKHVKEKKPTAVTLCGERVMLIREQGRVFALYDRCPHRGVPLSHPMATQEFPGTWSCGYHGWTYSLEDGARRGHHRRTGVPDRRQGGGQDVPGRRDAGPRVPLDRRRRAGPVRG